MSSKSFYCLPRKEKREYTGPSVAGVPGALEFDIVIDRSHPRVTWVSMLGLVQIGL